jgi:hypothetical protein
MPTLINALRHWNTDAFSLTLKNELENLPSGVLPLEKGVTQGGYIDDSNIVALILHSTADENSIHAKAGIFFTEIVANCGCGDEPMVQNAYCEIQIRIDKKTAATDFALLTA